MSLILPCNFLVAGSYFVIAAQLVTFLSNQTVLSVIRGENNRVLCLTASALFLLFAGFICICGLVHLIHGLSEIYPGSDTLPVLMNVMVLLCAIVSVVTCIVSFFLLPTVIKVVAEAVLRSRQVELSESYLIEIINMLKESVIVVSSDGKVTRGNAISTSIFGPGFTGHQLSSLVFGEDRKMFQKALHQVLNSDAEEVPVSIEYRVKRSEGETSESISSPTSNSNYIWVESTFCKGSTLQPDGTTKHDVKMISRSIDDRKRTAHYRQYYQEMKKKEAVNEAKLRYISCVAHDLKTPLQSFCFTVDLLSDSAKLSPEQSELLQHANVAVDLMKLTISQTMDISKALTGVALQPRRQPVRLSSVIERVRVIINGFGKQVPVTFEVSPIICDTIITDEEWLWQMLLNLLTNACKYTDHGSIHVKVTLAPPPAEQSSDKTVAPVPTPRAEPKGAQSVMAIEMVPIVSAEHMLFEVHDTGVGIREEKLGSIFDAFSQVQTGQVTGTGLGLFGVRRRAEGLQGACGARHNLQSSTGTGTVIWFSIPYVVDRSESLSDKSNGGFAPLNLKVVRAKPGVSALSVSPSALTNMIRERGLVAMVVEDTLSIRKLMERTLVQLGFEKVLSYENGSKGLDAMMAGAVDIVLSDLQMPIMTGHEMVARFRAFEADALASRARYKRQLIVAVSANVDGDHMLEGFDLVCSKPLARAELSGIVYQYLCATENA